MPIKIWIETINERPIRAAIYPPKERILSPSASQPPLAEQVAIITGAGRGIGAAIATSVASMGARTILCGRARAALDNTAAAIQNNGHQSTVIECEDRKSTRPELQSLRHLVCRLL